MQALERIEASPGFEEAPRLPRPVTRRGIVSRSYSLPADPTGGTRNVANGEDFFGPMDRERRATPKVAQCPLPVPVCRTMPPQRGVLPRPDVAQWFSECVEPEHPLLQVLPPEAMRSHGSARIAQANGNTLVLLPRPEAITPERKKIVEHYVASGISNTCTVLVREAGKLRRINSLGRSFSVPNGLYTFGIDQSERLLTGIAANPLSSIACSAQKGAGAHGNHAHLTAQLPGLFFGELEVQDDEVVGFNNRSGTFLTPAALAPQAKAHPLLANATFYPCSGDGDAHELHR